MGPILHGIQEYTGLQGFMLLGGPMPRYNGEIGCMQCVHPRFVYA